MVRWLALALVLAAAAPARAAPPPLAGVGLLEVDDGGGCTAALIAPDLVLTAAHCTYMRVRGKRVAADQLTFRTGAYPGHAARDFAGADYVTHPFHEPGERQDTGNLRYDVALVRLAEPVPAEVAAPLPVAAFEPGGAPPLVASFRGPGTDRARERRCPLLERNAGFLVLTCAVRQGESGAPVLLTDGGIRLVGVLAAQSRIMRSEVALGAEAAPVIGALRGIMGVE